MRKFFVISSQRSGTTWFCEKLAGMFGRWGISEKTNIRWWEELSSSSFIDRKKLDSYYLPKPDYLVQDFFERQFLLNLESFITLDYKHVIRKTPQFYNDVYNSLNDNEFLNVMYEQCGINCMLDYPVIHLIRKDTVAQATSIAVAQQTNIYHNNNHYSEKIENLKDNEKNINLNYNEVVFEAEKLNLYKKVYFETLNTYHKNCLTIFYEDCLNENYWKNTLNEKLEKFMKDSIKNAKFETEHKKTGKMFNIVNSCGNDWFENSYHRAIGICVKNDLPVNADSLTKVLKFRQ